MCAHEQSVLGDKAGRRMLQALYDHGFLPYHAHFSGLKAYGCCWIEYTLLNTRAPLSRMPFARNATLSPLRSM